MAEQTSAHHWKQDLLQWALNFAQRFQGEVGAAERGGGGDGDDGPVRDAGDGLGRGDKLGHAGTLTGRDWPVLAASRTASATASEAIPSSPVAAGAPCPATAARKSVTAWT